jgi:hypothetical protein
VGERREAVALAKEVVANIEKLDCAGATDSCNKVVAKIESVKAKGAGNFCPTEEKGEGERERERERERAQGKHFVDYSPSMFRVYHPTQRSKLCKST